MAEPAVDMEMAVPSLRRNHWLMETIVPWTGKAKPTPVKPRKTIENSRKDGVNPSRIKPTPLRTTPMMMTIRGPKRSDI